MAQYRHPSVPARAGGFDPGFQGYGATRSGAQGLARLRTIKPVAYPGRTPHIHFTLRHASFGTLTSQLFVAGDPGNARDFLWRRLAGGRPRRPDADAAGGHAGQRPALDGAAHAGGAGLDSRKKCEVSR